jgi:multidrug efflux pump subunit AcrA (membrane-fusion protein)
LGCLLAVACTKQPGLESTPGIGVVKRDTLEQKITISGNVVPNRSTMITGPFLGYVKKLYVKVGDKIATGDPIVTMAQSLQSNEHSFPLRAPFPGTVVQVGRTEGQLVHEGVVNEFIVRIDDLSRLFVTANAPEIDWVKLSPGQEVVIRAAAILTRTYKGVIRELSLAAKADENGGWGNNSKVEFPIRLEVLDADKQLSPGMTVVVDIIAHKVENVLVLPHEYVSRDEGKFFVHLENGEKRMIEIGLQNEEAFEIKSGLKEGDRVKQVDFASLLKE